MAQLAKAPVSKTGDSRFESWLPRSPAPIIPGVRRALAIAVVSTLLLAPGAADAAVRYASPGGGTVLGCERETPCSLEYAIAVAKANDEVVVLPGLYSVRTKIETSVPLTVRGETVDSPSLPGGGSRPQIVGAPTVTPLESTARLTISDLTMSSRETGLGTLVAVGDGSVFERLDLVASGEGVAALRPGNSFTVTNSLLRGNGEFAGALFLQGTETGLGTVRNSTLIGSGPGSTGLGVFAALAGATNTIEAVNVIADAVTDVSATAAPGAGVAIALDHSNFDTSMGPVTGTANQTAPPLFVNVASGDFHQAPASPTRNAGITDPANGATDLDGNPRAYGGEGFGCDAPRSAPVTDIGAYEDIYAIAVPAIFCRPGIRIPDTRITAAMIRSEAGRAKFRFRAVGRATGFQRKLTRAKPKARSKKRPKPKKFRKCSSPKAFRNLRPGRYRFAVRAVNEGAIDRTPAKRRFRYS